MPVDEEHDRIRARLAVTEERVRILEKDRDKLLNELAQMRLFRETWDTRLTAIDAAADRVERAAGLVRPPLLPPHP